MPTFLIPVLTTLAGAGGSLGIDAITKYIGLLVDYLDDVDGGDERLTLLHEHLKRIVAEGRPPTDDEYADLKARGDAAYQRIQNA